MQFLIGMMVALIGLVPDEEQQRSTPALEWNWSKPVRTNFQDAGVFPMKFIPIINQHFLAVVDDEDFELLSEMKWYWSPRSGVCTHFYIFKKVKQARMHRIVMDAPKGMLVDHWNHAIWDNQKHNLRICNSSQNQANRLPFPVRPGGFKFRSRFKGVTWHKNKKRFYANITILDKTEFVGSFKNERDAALAYNDAAVRTFGEFALINKL